MRIHGNPPVFRVLGGRGFQITFENGCTASIMFGPGNYCEARSVNGGWAGNTEQHESGTAEVACWGPDGTMLLDAEEHGDQVLADLTPAEAIRFLTTVEKHVVGRRFSFQRD